MKTFTVNAWNVFNFDFSGRKVVATDYLAKDLISALNMAEKDSKRWNKGQKNENQIVKIISCNGFVRNIF